jgi:hypothetical protein
MRSCGTYGSTRCTRCTGAPTSPARIPGGCTMLSYFLSPATREAYWSGGCDLVPNHFSEMPHLLRTETRCSIVLAAVSAPDRHGYFSLGTNAEYVAALIGRVPFYVEVNARMPQTRGRNQIHSSQRALSGHRDLGIHTELLSDGIVELVERGVVTGARKTLHPNRIVTTFALGTQRLYDWTAARRSSCCTRRPAPARVASGFTSAKGPSSPPQERCRPRRHRVGHRQASRSLARRSGLCAHRHRAPGAS